MPSEFHSGGCGIGSWRTAAHFRAIVTGMAHLTRRDLAWLAAAPLAAAVNYRSYAQCWPDFLRKLASEAYDRRKAEIAKLTTAAAISARQQWVPRTLWPLIGGEPARTPLDVRVRGEFPRDGYRVEKLTYESQPGLIVTANLYIPSKMKPPYPGVLFQMGHALNGKANDGYQRCCQGLARLGYLVLAFDPMGQGERTYYPQPAPATLTRLGSADDEHTVPGQQMLLVGDSATRMQLWDAVRSLDVLAAHPLADPKRLASTGQSGGATLTMLLAAVDSRLAAAALTCGNTENFACRDFNPPGSTDDAEQNFVDGARHGFDRWDLLYPLAPKPLLIAASARDFFGTYSPNYLSSGREEFAHLERVYKMLGQPSHLRWVEGPLPHGLTEPMRLEIYNWFERHLNGRTKPIETEPPTAPENEETLWTGRTGNAVRDQASLRPLDLVRERLNRTKPTGKPDWPRLLALPRVPVAAPAVLGRTRFGSVQIEAIEVASETPVFVPAWHYQPAKTNGKLVVVIEPGGRSTRWQEGQMLHQLALEGFAVCAADVRGVGDLRPEAGRGQAPYAQSHAREEHWAWAGLMLGRPVLGQRVTDLLALVRALRRARPGEETHVAAAGRLVPVGLLATALEPGITAFHRFGPLPELRQTAAKEEYDQPFADFVPGLLLTGDLPDAAQRVRVLENWSAAAIKKSLLRAAQE